MEKNSNKWICPECGKEHSDKECPGLYELAEMTAESFTAEAFPGFWQECKEKLKELSKKEIAEEAFYAGAMSMLHAYMLTMNDSDLHKDEQELL